MVYIQLQFCNSLAFHLIYQKPYQSKASHNPQTHKSLNQRCIKRNIKAYPGQKGPHPQHWQPVFPAIINTNQNADQHTPKRINYKLYNTYANIKQESKMQTLLKCSYCLLPRPNTPYLRFCSHSPLSFSYTHNHKLKKK